MVKVRRKKSSKRSENTSDDTVKVTPEVCYDDEEEHVNEEDDDLTSEEEEDERKHQKLLEAISSLGAQRRRWVGERSEASVNMSEFTVSTEGGGDRIDLSDLIGTMEKTPTVSKKSTKQLKHLQTEQRTIESPLSKQESERIQRDVAFQKTSSEVSRWKPIIQQNQRAEQLVFPLHREPSGPKPMEKVVTSWKAHTPLEEEIFALLSANKQPIHDPILTPSEEASMKAMSLKEARIRRAELQKVRALQSYYESKARRDKKIKSKKYHKVHNKAKRKEFLKHFDQMVKTDPAAALEELEKMEVARMKERMSLKHQNSSKWAKSKAVMAKYDEGARRAMQQQLEVNKDLTQKVVTSLNNDVEEEEEEAREAEVLPDFVNDAEPGLYSSNPWMRGKLSEDPSEKDMSSTVDSPSKGPAAVEEEEEEEKIQEPEEEVLLREFDRKRKLRQAEEAEPVPVINVEEEDGVAAVAVDVSDDEEEEEEELSEFKGLHPTTADDCQDAATSLDDSAALLQEGLMRIRTLQDVELLIQEEEVSDETPVQADLPPGPEKPPAGTVKKRKRGIELQEVLTKETKVIRVPLAQTIEDPEDSEENLDQRGLIKEAFAGDDVISDFLNDKRNQEEAGKPKLVDLTLPGWGDWGGIGLKLPRKKRRRFRIKSAAPPPRKDQHLPSVIISEQRNSSISVHQVNSLPFPFQDHTQFESTIRTPTGRTWNTERTVQKITKPKVVTQLGAIIQPMAREELLKNTRQQTSAGSRGGVDPRRRKGELVEKMK